MSNYALVVKNNVENIFICDNDDIAKSLFPDDLVVNVDDEPTLCIGCSYKDGKFIYPEIPEKTKDELISEFVQEKNNLRILADSEIVWRQDAVDAEIATDEEVAKLAAWKKYRVLLMRIDTSKAPDIKWPKVPA